MEAASLCLLLAAYSRSITTRPPSHPANDRRSRLRVLDRDGHLNSEFYQKKLIELNSKYLDELNAVILLSDTAELKEAERDVFDELETMKSMLRSLQELGPYEDDTFLLPNEH